MRMRRFLLAVLPIAFSTATPLTMQAQWGQWGRPRARETTLHPRTFELAGTFGRLIRPDHRYEYGGYAAQFSLQRGKHLLVGGQFGALTRSDSYDGCASPERLCPTPSHSYAYLAPHVGVGARADMWEVRLFAGPRFTVAGNAPFVSAQLGGDLSWGVERVALYLPLTLAWTSWGGSKAEMSTIGIGLQLR